ncbi:MAG: GYD domain-containing protein [Deltaproteobacteria bacterium]|nr:GYD domain-containing protein [Deltaproteobacteria bacterium]
MPTFVLMTKLTSELLDAKDRREVGRAWLKRVKTTCPQVKWIGHYALLGRYDFMDIYEAPDVETAHRVSILSRAEGAIEAESLQALPYDRFLELLDEVHSS